MSSAAPSRRWLAAILAAAPGVALLSFRVGATPGMISDSVHYYAAATAIATHSTLRVPLAFSLHEQFDSAGRLISLHPFVLWPPGYPLALVLVARVLSVPIDFAAAIVNAVALGVLLLATAWLVERVTESRTALAVAMLFGVLPIVQGIFRTAASEPLFLACCASTLVSLTWWLEDPRRRALALWLAALSIGAAVHVRYVGIFLVPLHAGCVAWVWRRGSAPVRVAALSVLAGPALGSLFLLHRLAAFGCAFCESRIASTQSFGASLADMAGDLLRSLPAVYTSMRGPLDTVLSLGVLVLLVAAQPRRSAPARRARREALFVCAGFAVIYAAGVLALRTTIEFDALDIRIMAPATLTAVAIGLAAVLDRRVAAGRFRVAAVGVFAFGVVGVLADRAEPWRGLSEPTPQEVALVEYARDHFHRRPGVPIFSSEASVLQTHLGFDEPVYWLPETGVPMLSAGERGVALVVRRPTADATFARLDEAAARIEQTGDFVAWELPSVP